MNISTLLVSTALLLSLLQAESFVTPPSSPNSVANRHGAVAVQDGGSETQTQQQKQKQEEEDYLWQIRLNIFEKTKTVTSVCTSGTLCTMSSHEGIEGSPFGSFVDYVLDDEGNPVLLMNEMSMHTINIQKNSMNVANHGATVDGSSLVTLFTQLAADTDSNNKGQDVSRVSLTCKVEKIPDDAEDMAVIRMRYSLAHAYADQVMDSPKFAFYRLLPEKIYFVGGFGVNSKWVDVEDYKTASPDILAKEANSIVKKLNREFKNDLTLMATQLLGVQNLQNIRVTNVDRLGMDVRVTSQMGTRRNKLMTDEFRIGFRIPVISVEDAKSEVLKVFQESWEKANNISWGEDTETPGSTVPIMKIAADGLE
ncbi:unnamed protein product [Cylindrotheca closterium]|uniref:DUF2470 domain-containing protein n=1 Tax=Cylindrotheca closterium TaxID=2856 RepID=A0AAD2PX02_9STRA|nr:unnamed protein product [Cylindrotheca closterium]